MGVVFGKVNVNKPGTCMVHGMQNDFRVHISFMQVYIFVPAYTNDKYQKQK